MNDQSGGPQVLTTNPEQDLEFQDMYGAFRDRIYRHLARLAGEHEAEDLTQEVFFRASRSLPSFEGKSQLSTWLFKIATNAAIDRLRNKTDRQTLAGDDLCGPEGEEPDWAVEESASAEQAVIRQEMNNCIRDMVQSLPENYRTALALSELDGFSNREISEITGASLETVKIRLHRARQALKKKLSLECDFYRNEQNEFACDRKNRLIYLP